MQADDSAPQRETTSRFAALLNHVTPTPPRNAKELRGLSFWRRSNKNMLWMAAPFFIIGCFALLAIALITVSDQSSKRIRMTRKTPGKVMYIAKSTMQGQIGYSFKASTGELYYGASPTIENSPYAHLKAGDPLTVAYDPSDPTQNEIAIYPRRQESIWPFILMAPIFMFGFVLMMFGPAVFAPASGLIAARRIYKRGILTTGNIRFITRRRNDNTYFHVASAPLFDLFYTFRDQQGNTVEGTQSCNNDWLVNKLDVDSAVTVVYLPPQSRKSIVLEAYIE